MCVIATIVLAAGGLAAWRFAQPPLRNYGVVWENRLTRSGLPRGDSGWRSLRRHGTKSIITFRPQYDVDYQRFGFERVFRITLKGFQDPTEEQADTFLGIIQDPGNWPVHMHCSAGVDRTGTMAALARYAIDGWPLDKALAEAKLYHRGLDLSPKRIVWLENWAAKHKPGSYRSSRLNASPPTRLLDRLARRPPPGREPLPERVPLAPFPHAEGRALVQ